MWRDHSGPDERIPLGLVEEQLQAGGWDWCYLVRHEAMCWNPPGLDEQAMV